MDMYDKIARGDYNPRMEFPHPLKKPFLDRKHSPKRAAEYAVEMTAYGLSLSEHVAKLDVYRQEKLSLDAQFKADAIQSAFGEDAERFPALIDAIWKMAYEDENGSGHSFIYARLLAYTAIINAVKKDQGVA